MPSELPPPARRFLRTAGGRRARAIVHALHRWLARRQLPLAALTPDHLAPFLARPRWARLSSKTATRYRKRLHDYLCWLHARALIGFDPEPLRRRPHPLPPLAREFLASLAPTHRPSTCLAYATWLRKFYAWLDPRGLEPQHLSRRDLVPWFEELHTAGVSPVTRHNLFIDVRAFLRWLSEHRRMRTAPDDLVRRSDFPKLPQYLPRPLTAEADRELQRRLGDSELPGAWALLLMRRTGLRIGELRGLEYHCMRDDHHRALLKVPLGKLHTDGWSRWTPAQSS